MGKPFTVMGLDLSYSRTGICLWDGVQARPSNIKTDTSEPYILRARKIALGVMQTLGDAGLVCIEAPLSHAHRAEILTGLFFMVMDALLDVASLPIVVLPNPSMRKLMGIRQVRGTKVKKSEIVEKAKATIGPSAPKMVHDEADAFFLAYYARRFWCDYRLQESVNLSESERQVWYSEEMTFKVPKNPKTKKKRRKVPKKKGIIYRQGEFLFLPECGTDPEE